MVSKIITVGNYANIVELRKALHEKGIPIDLHADNVLNKIDLVRGAVSVEVDFVSNLDLGFRLGAKLKNTFTRARERMLAPCPGEVGAQLCIQNDDRLYAHNVIPVMKPIVGFHSGEVHLFRIVASSGRCGLLVTSGALDSFYGPETVFVFQRQPEKVA